jgi:hypothetical protein
MLGGFTLGGAVLGGIASSTTETIFPVSGVDHSRKDNTDVFYTKATKQTASSVVGFTRKSTTGLTFIHTRKDEKEG